MTGAYDWTGGDQVVAAATTSLLLRRERGDGARNEREAQRLTLLRGGRIVLGRPDPKGLAENEQQFDWPTDFFPRLDLRTLSRRLVTLELDGDRLLIRLSERLTAATGPRLFSVRLDGRLLDASAEAAGTVSVPFGNGRAQVAIELLAPSNEAERRSLRLIASVDRLAQDGGQTLQAGWTFQEDALGLVRTEWWDRVRDQAVGRLVLQTVAAMGGGRGDEATVRAALRRTHPGDSLGNLIRSAVESLIKEPRGSTARDWNAALRQANLAELYVTDPRVSLSAATDATRTYEPTKSLETFLELCRRLRDFRVLDDYDDELA